jgi:hypothetical protein
MFVSRIIDYDFAIYDNRSLRDLTRRKRRRGSGIKGASR